MKELTATAPEEMWVTDLDKIEECWEEVCVLGHGLLCDGRVNLP